MQNEIISLEKQHEYLIKVSRTFALTIPTLPDALKDYVSNAYLLCRMADTIEDDPIADTEKKYAWLKDFALYASAEFVDELKLMQLHHRAKELVKDGAKPTEYELIEDMPRVLLRTCSYPQKIKAILAKGVSIMSYGMAKSVRNSTITSLKDVDVYCYFVAGVVGELLAALFTNYNTSINKTAMMNLSVSFGEGLQLTNILKDRYVDSERDASFLPKSTPGGEKEEIFYYASICQGHLDDALDFICMIPTSETGLRLFCLLNIAMATATVRKIFINPMGNSIHLKISRKTVKMLFVLCSWCSKNNFMTKMLFKYLSRGILRNRRNPSELRQNVSWWDKETYNILIEEK